MISRFVAQAERHGGEGANVVRWRSGTGAGGEGGRGRVLGGGAREDAPEIADVGEASVGERGECWRAWRLFLLLRKREREMQDTFNNLSPYFPG